MLGKIMVFEGIWNDKFGFEDSPSFALELASLSIINNPFLF